MKLKDCKHPEDNVDYFGFCKVCRGTDKALGWIITKSYIEGTSEETEKGISVKVNIQGPRSTPYNKAELIKGHPFKMYDDDDNLYYEGFFLGDKTGEEAFAPLDDYGTGAAGCTKIFYKVGRKWEQL